MKIWVCFITIVWVIVVIWYIVEEIRYYREIKKDYTEMIRRCDKLIEEYEKKYNNHDNDWK